MLRGRLAVVVRVLDVVDICRFADFLVTSAAFEGENGVVRYDVVLVREDAFLHFCRCLPMVAVVPESGFFFPFTCGFLCFRIVTVCYARDVSVYPIGVDACSFYVRDRDEGCFLPCYVTCVRDRLGDGHYASEEAKRYFLVWDVNLDYSGR